jgi:hypothetical protein
MLAMLAQLTLSQKHNGKAMSLDVKLPSVQNYEKFLWNLIMHS